MKIYKINKETYIVFLVDWKGFSLFEMEGKITGPLFL